jgi:hypothetical protein
VVIGAGDFRSEQLPLGGCVRNNILFIYLFEEKAEKIPYLWLNLYWGPIPIPN